MSWTFAEERPIYWEEPPEQIAITNVETGDWDAYMLTSKAMRMIRDAKDDANWLHAELHGAELKARKVRKAERTCYRVSDYIPASGYNDEIYWDDECSECHERGLETDHNYCPYCGAKVVEA